MLPVSSQIFYARKWPVLVIFIILGLPFIILKILGNQDRGLDLFLLIDIIFCFLLFVWAKYMSIFIDDHGIEFRILFKKRFMAWRDIHATKLAFEFDGKSGDFVWNFIAINGKEINFSTGYFSKKTIYLIAGAVVEKCPAYLISGKIKEISEGKFPWYIF